MKFILKISSMVFLFCFLSQNSFSQQNTNGWFWVNGQAQANDLHWVKIIDDTHYYAVGENGTFMKSSDGGDSWLINSQAGVPDNSFGAGASYRLYTGWFFNANTGIVAGQSAYNENIKIKRTTDGGDTFSTIDLGTSTGSPRVFDIQFINSNTGFLCGSSNVKVFKTTNAGLNWTPMSNLPVYTYSYRCLYAIDENNIILGTESDGINRDIVRTTNGGSTWNVQTLPGSVIVSFNDIDFMNASTGFICGTSVSSNPNYFASTTDGGASWVEGIFPNKQNPLYDLKIKDSKVYALGASFTSYFYSSDLGITWDSVYFNDPSNLNQPYQYFVNAFDFYSGNQIIVGMYGKVNVSYDNGSTWRNKNYSVGNNEITYYSIYAQPGTSNVWAGGGGGRILRSSNNGTNWTLFQTSASYAFYDIEMLNSSTGYAVGGNLFAGVGYCFKTTNGGVSWNSLTISTPTTPLYNLDFVNESTGWLFGGYPFGSPGVISKTTNGGLTWVNQTSTPVINNVISNGAFYDANTGYCYSGTNLLKTVNGGVNWNIVNTAPLGNSFNGIHIFSNSVIFMGSGRKIFKSFNSGSSWDTVYLPTSENVMFDMDWTDLNNGTVVGTQGYTAKTKDGGLTWKERNTGTSTTPKVSMKSKDTVYTVCDRNVWGAIFRLYDSPGTSISLDLTVGIQGFWNGTAQVGDTVKCHLRNSVSPYNEIEVTSAVLNASGNAVFIFNSAPSGNYYLEITHRNSLETWSGSPLALTAGGSFAYNFTTAASQAYGNNMVLKSGRYCDYSGDVNQDGLVDLTDVVIVNNSASVFTVGYVVQDVNGDNLVDLSDLIITLNNASIFVAKIVP